MIISLDLLSQLYQDLQDGVKTHSIPRISKSRITKVLSKPRRSTVLVFKVRKNNLEFQHKMEQPVYLLKPCISNT